MPCPIHDHGDDKVWRLQRFLLRFFPRAIGLCCVPRVEVDFSFKRNFGLFDLTCVMRTTHLHIVDQYCSFTFENQSVAQNQLARSPLRIEIIIKETIKEK